MCNEAGLGPLNFGLTTVWRKATTRDEWRHIVDTATLHAAEYALKEEEVVMYTKEYMKKKKSQFSTNFRLYFGNDTRYGHSYNGRRIGTRTQSIQWCHFE